MAVFPCTCHASQVRPTQAHLGGLWTWLFVAIGMAVAIGLLVLLAVFVGL